MTVPYIYSNVFLVWVGIKVLICYARSRSEQWENNLLVVLPRMLTDGLPGLVVWFVTVCCVLGAYLYPRVLFVLATFLALYMALRFLTAVRANLRGLRLVRSWQMQTWCTDVDVHHLVVIPNYHEPELVLSRSLDNLARSRMASQMTVVLAMEAREIGWLRKAQTLEQQFAGSFAHFFVTSHPDGLPGETRSKAANLTWAVRRVRHKLVDQLRYDPDTIVVTTMDADTLWHPAYFDALTHHFATDPHRHARFWQAPIRYHSNIYEVHPLVRSINAYSTAMELACLAEPRWMALPISSYSLSLRLLTDSGYWDGDVIADEWHMFIKAYFTVGGGVSVVPIYLPFMAMAVTGETLWDTIRNRYQQSLRHAWGSREMGYTLAHMAQQSGGWRILSRIAHDVLLTSAGWVMISLGSQLPILFQPSAVFFTDVPFILFQLSALLVSLFSLVLLLLDMRTRPPRGAALSRMEQVQIVAGFLLLPVMALLFVVLPLIHAQTRLLLGFPLEFRVTPKSLPN